MPKAKKADDELELSFSNDKDTKAESVLDGGDTEFDDLNPRFSKQLNAAAAAEQRESVIEDDEEDLDDEPRRGKTEPEDDEEDLDDEPEVETGEEDLEDDDEPQRGRSAQGAFRRRLAREQRLREETQTQVAELTARLNKRETDDKIAANESEFKTFESTAKTKLDSLRAKKIAAIENGNTSEQADLEDQIGDLKADLAVKRSKYETAKTQLEETSKRREISPIVATKVAQWKRRNPRYGTDPEFTAAVNAIDATLTAGGSNNEDDGHYKKIDRKLVELKLVKGPKVRKHPSAQQGGESTAVVRSRREERGARIEGGKLRVPPTELKRIQNNMARFGLDGNDPKAVRDYVANNRRSTG